MKTPSYSIHFCCIAIALLGCQRGDGGTRRFALKRVEAQALPGLADDQLRIVFTQDPIESEATDLSHYGFEMPIGRRVPLGSATAGYDPDTRTVTVTFHGDAALAVNLAVGTTFRLTASGIHDMNGAEIASATSVAGRVTGTNAPPTLDSIDPVRSDTRGGIDITIRGTGFTFASDTRITLGTAELTGLVEIDGRSQRGQLTRGVPGFAEVILRNSNGEATTPNGFEFTLPFPLFDGMISHPFPEGGAVGVTISDLDLDGAHDLVALGVSIDLPPGQRRLHVLKGKSNGDFELTGTLNAGILTNYVVIADIDSNGLPDIAYTSHSETNVALRLGFGGLTFGDPILIAVPQYAKSLALADVNGDFTPDLVVAHPAGLSILLGDGTGHFEHGADIPLPGNLQEIATSDVNEDGRIDIAGALTSSGFAGTTGWLVVVHNVDGTGTRWSRSQYHAGTKATALASGDVDGNGSMDFATSDNLIGFGSISVFLNRADDSFAPRLTIRANASDVLIADLFSNGRSGILATALGLSYWTYEKPDMFSEPTSIPAYATSIATAALTDTGLLDIVTASSSSLTVITHRDDGSLRVPTTIAIGTNPQACSIGDYSSDGKLDLAVVDQGSRDVTILIGDGSGEFVAQPAIPAGDGPSSILSANLDQDDRIDLIVGDERGGTLLFFAGDGHGTFGSPKTSRLGSSPKRITLIDLDGDGDLDVAATCQREIRVALNDGDGVFCQPAPSGFDAQSDATFVFGGGDFDGDGNADIAYCGDNYSEGGILGVAFGSGDGSFAEITRVRTGEGESCVAMLDLDGDEFLDMVAAGTLGDESPVVRVLFGDGTRSLPSEDSEPSRVATFAGPRHPVWLEAGDFDADGDLDLAISSSRIGARDTHVLANDGTGHFALLGAVGGFFGHLSAADLNGDGALDMVSTNGTSVIIVLSRA